MKYIKILFGLFFIYILIRDYRLTKGLYIKAKVFHLIALVFLFFYYSSSYDWLTWAIKNPEKLNDLYNDYSFLSNNLVKISLILHHILGIIITLVAIGLLNRNKYCRKILLIILPIIVFPSSIIVFMGFKSNFDYNINNYIALIICFFMTVLLNIWVFLIYNSKIMISYFENKVGKNK